MKVFFIKIILVVLMLAVVGNVINMFISLLLNSGTLAIKHFIYAVICSVIGVLINAKYKKVIN